MLHSLSRAAYGYLDVGGGNTPDAEPHMLSNIPLKWMLKEIVAGEHPNSRACEPGGVLWTRLADTGLIFRRSALERAHIDLDEIVQAAERTKIDDAKREKV